MVPTADATLSRLDELLADRALADLEPAENAELERLLAAHPEIDAQTWERAAAAALLALIGPPDEPVPESLRRRVEADARRELARGPGDRSAAAPSRPATRPSRPATRPSHPATPLPRRGRAGVAREALAWALAAAALGFALLPFPEPDPEAGLRERLAAESGTLTLPWTATDDPAAVGAGGEVLWNNELQEGVMVLRGLAANDPRASQYQLWIFDASRDEAQPVDGGVFDVSRSEGEVVVPIRARLPIAEPTLFAVTIERPGGVVVSHRERLPLLARVGS